MNDVKTQAPVQLVTIDDDATWFRRGDQHLFLADMLDQDSGVAMTVGFARYGKGESNPWTLSYDEALIVSKGRFTVSSGTDSTTATVGQVIYLRSGADVVYRADEDTELVMVTYPHWYEATTRSPYAERLEQFQPL